MEEIVGHFGEGFLHLAAAVVVLAVIAAIFFGAGGIVREAVTDFLVSICG